MTYTVSNIPIVLKPLFWLYSYMVAVFVYTIFLLLHATVRIEYRNKEVLKDGQNYIFSLWHEHLMGHFVVFTRYDRDYVWLNHPIWFMKPIHLILHWMGTKRIALGSSGNSGKVALLEVISSLKEGYNTIINPDGPAGPKREIKDGVLNMSIATGVAVVPLKITSLFSITTPTWDRKRLPIPFSRIIVEYGEPIVVTEAGKEEARRILHKAM